MPASQQDNLLDLTVLNREEIVFQGKVKSVTSYNEKGKFDVLPQHSNSISLLQKGLIYRLISGQEKEIPVSDGVIKVQENKINVYLGIGEVG